MSRLRLKRKPHSGRCVVEQGVKHWLGEGSDGQESLFLDLDPFLFAADTAVCRFASSIAHNYDGDQKKPFAVLVQPSGTVGWHLGRLSNKYDLCIWSNDVDEILEAAAEFFGARVKADLESNMEASVDLFLFTKYVWSNLLEFAEAFHDAQSFLSDEGALCMLLQCQASPQGVEICWSDGTGSWLEELVSGGCFRLPSCSDSVLLWGLQ